MLFAADTLDDVLLELYPALLGASTVRTTRGETTELIATQIEIKNPRARLSRSETRGKMFSALGELLWYLTRDNQLDFISRYVSRYKDETEDGKTIFGGYGPRLFAQRKINQIENVIRLLKDKSSSRRATIQIFNAEDIDGDRHQEIPCTTTFQFLVRDERLHMITTMRSNDAYLGLPHDVFCFTMLQELIASALHIEVASYFHFVGSMHLYTANISEAQDFVGEGFQQRISMPPMPPGDPCGAIQTILNAEAAIRNGAAINLADYPLAPYWLDLIRLLQIFATSEPQELDALKATMDFEGYRTYINARIARSNTQHRNGI